VSASKGCSVTKRVAVQDTVILLEEARPLLGVLSDCEIGRRFNVSREMVRYHRCKAGIGPASRKTWPPERDALLGQETDGKLAKRWGLKAATVGQRRRALGIPAKRPPRLRPGLIAICPKKVKAIRQAKGVTLYTLAQGNHVLIAHLNKIEKAREYHCTLDTLEKLCKLLGCSECDVKV
jgi:DNA-binding Xre family transcriptional regulator